MDQPLQLMPLRQLDGGRGFRALAGEGAATADRVALYQYVLLVVVLAALASVPVPLAG